MSEPAAPPEKEVFSREDQREFMADDVEAGSAIGKMLSLFFLYTVLAMSLAAWWTFSDTEERATAEPVSAESHAH